MAKDHYVAKAYLKRFYDKNDCLHVFNKKNKKHFACNSAYICWERDWDLINGIDENNKNLLSEILQFLEPNINNYMDCLIEGSLTNEDKYSLSLYFAVLNLLNPSTIENMSDMLENMVSSSTDALLKSGTIPIPDNISSKENPFYKIKVNKNHTRYQGIKTVPFACMSYYTSQWLVIKNNSNFKFLTCDFPFHPLCLNNNQSMHKKGIALSPDYYLLIAQPDIKLHEEMKKDSALDFNKYTPGKTSYGMTKGEKGTKFFNQHTIRNATNLIISLEYDTRLEKFVKKNINTHTKTITERLPHDGGELIITRVKNFD